MVVNKWIDTTDVLLCSLHNVKMEQMVKRLNKLFPTIYTVKAHTTNI
jgi:hypothetical protein